MTHRDILKTLATSGKWHKNRCIEQLQEHVRLLTRLGGQPTHEWIDIVLIAWLGYMAETGTIEIPEAEVDARLAKFLEKLPERFPVTLPQDPE